MSELQEMHEQIEKVWGVSTDHINADVLHKYIDEQHDHLSRIKALVAEQAEDDGLWFTAETAPEAYLQQVLRELHQLIEENHE